MRMPTCLLVAAVLVCVPLQVRAGALVHAWSQHFGDTDSDRCEGLAVDGWGNVVAGGYFSGSIDLGGGTLTAASQDIYIAKFDATGAHLWSQSFGDINGQSLCKIAIDAAGNIAVLGSFSGSVDLGGGNLTSAGGSDIFLAKFDPAGTHLWSQSFGDANGQYGENLTIDGLGNVLINGQFEGGVDFGGGVLTSAGDFDVFLAKFDATGSHLWSQSFGDTVLQAPRGLVCDAVGNVYLSGYTYGDIDFGGGLLVNAGNSDAYFAKFDPSGAHLWSQIFGEAESQFGSDIAVDDAGNVYATAYYRGDIDFGGGTLTSAGNQDISVAKFDAAGSHIWSKRFGDANADLITGITLDGFGNMILTGYFQGGLSFGGTPLVSAGNNDLYVAKLDTTGGHQWSQRFGNASSQFAGDADVDAFGNLFMGGRLQGSVDFGGGFLTSAGGYDAYLVKLWRAAPEIHAVRDVPGDQGGFVYLSWDASGADTPGDHMITDYTLWRAISPTAAQAMLTDGAFMISTPSDLADPAIGSPVLREAPSLSGGPYYWSLMKTVPAYYLTGYAETMPTLFDSTSASSEHHYFQVIAHTSDPYTFWTSDPDSGYSVDNLAPAAPMSLVAEQVSPSGSLTISWRANAEVDLSHYAVYRGSSPGFTPGPGNLLGSSPDTALTDAEWTWDSGFYYKVSALDFHENESPYASLDADQVTGVGGPSRAGNYLSQNVPNPFNPSTVIEFGLVESGPVTLEIFDVSGRRVRVLVNEKRAARQYRVEWDGRDDAGHPVVTGVYFYRLRTSSFISTRKMIVLK